MEKFREKHSLPKLTQNEIENMNVPTSIKEIKLLSKTFP